MAAAAALLVASASAAPKQGKTYSMVVESPETAGVIDSDYTVTITNTTGTQQLGSANVTIPTVPASLGAADFFVTSEPSFTGAVASGATIRRNPAGGKVIELRNLALPAFPNSASSVTFKLGLRMPCLSGAYLWGVDARQSNDFSGTPGNTLGPATGTLRTTVEGSCRLRFVDETPTTPSGQPASAGVNDEITPDAFDPDSTKLITVEAVDGSPTSPQRLSWFTDAIDLDAANGPGSLSTSSPATAGVATFDELSLDKSGNYNLIASTTEPGVADDESADFQIIDDVGVCPGPGCTAHVDGSKTSSTLTGTDVTDNGFALLSLNLGTEPICAGYTPPSTDWYEFQLTVEGDKTVEAFYTKAAMKNVAGPSALQICFASPQFFVAQGGAQPFDYDGDEDTGTEGAEGFVGLLPIGCPAVPESPCVQSRNGTTGGGAIVTFFVPKAWGDPRYR